MDAMRRCHVGRTEALVSPDQQRKSALQKRRQRDAERAGRVRLQRKHLVGSQHALVNLHCASLRTCKVVTVVIVGVPMIGESLNHAHVHVPHRRHHPQTELFNSTISYAKSHL